MGFIFRDSIIVVCFLALVVSGCLQKKQSKTPTYPISRIKSNQQNLDQNQFADPLGDGTLSDKDERVDNWLREVQDQFQIQQQSQEQWQKQNQTQNPSSLAGGIGPSAAVGWTIDEQRSFITNYIETSDQLAHDLRRFATVEDAVAYILHLIQEADLPATAHQTFNVKMLQNLKQRLLEAKSVEHLVQSLNQIQFDLLNRGGTVARGLRVSLLTVDFFVTLPITLSAAIFVKAGHKLTSFREWLIGTPYPLRQPPSAQCEKYGRYYPKFASSATYLAIHKNYTQSVDQLRLTMGLNDAQIRKIYQQCRLERLDRYYIKPFEIHATAFEEDRDRRILLYNCQQKMENVIPGRKLTYYDLLLAHLFYHPVTANHLYNAYMQVLAHNIVYPGDDSKERRLSIYYQLLKAALSRMLRYKLTKQFMGDPLFARNPQGDYCPEDIYAMKSQEAEGNFFQNNWTPKKYEDYLRTKGTLSKFISSASPVVFIGQDEKQKAVAYLDEWMNPRGYFEVVFPHSLRNFIADREKVSAFLQFSNKIFDIFGNPETYGQADLWQLSKLFSPDIETRLEFLGLVASQYQAIALSLSDYYLDRKELDDSALVILDAALVYELIPLIDEAIKAKTAQSLTTFSLPAGYEVEQTKWYHFYAAVGGSSKDI